MGWLFHGVRGFFVELGLALICSALIFGGLGFIGWVLGVWG